VSVKNVENLIQTMYDAVLFDNDGVLVELMDIESIYGAVEETFGEFGVEPSPQDVETLVGVGPETLDRVCSKYCIDPESFWRRRDENVSRVQRAAFEDGGKPPYDDIDVVERLARSRDAAVVSNNQQATVDHVVSSLGLPVESVHGRNPTVESLRRKKPSPFYVERALDELGTRDAVYVGDSGTDVVAAEAAGIDSAFVRRPHRTDATLDAEPTYEVDSLYELEEELEGS
jgi:HAD superfamily hydrolase (TIGR01549 family)